MHDLSENHLPEGLKLQGCSVYPSPDHSSTFFYIPGVPIPETDANGSPTFNLWMSDEWAMLQCGVRWELQEHQLEMLKTTIADHYHLNLETIRLAPAPISVHHACLQLRDPDGSLWDLKTEQTSNYPPYTALFNVQLSGAEKGIVAAAIGGREDLLFIVYQGTLAIPTTIAVSVSGDAQPLLSDLPPHPTLEACRRQITMAIERNQLNLQYSGDRDDLSELNQRAKQTAIDKAAILLHSMANHQNYGESTLKTRIELTENTEVGIKRCTDLSTWFSENSGTEHIQIFPGQK